MYTVVPFNDLVNQSNGRIFFLIIRDRMREGKQNHQRFKILFFFYFLKKKTTKNILNM